MMKRAAERFLLQFRDVRVNLVFNEGFIAGKRKEYIHPVIK
jgi:hypothetical protein